MPVPSHGIAPITSSSIKKFFENENPDEKNKVTEFGKFVFFYITQWMPLEKLKSHFKSIPEYGKNLYESINEKIREFYPESFIFFK